MIGLILLVFAFVLAICAAMNWPSLPRPHLGWLAFACFIAYLLVEHSGGVIR